MRGKREFILRKQLESGITPADAGKTNEGWLCIAIAQDHPRGCGENKYQSLLRELQLGSPPRMRGKPLYMFRNV